MLDHRSRKHQWRYSEIDAPRKLRSTINIERFATQIARHGYEPGSYDWPEDFNLDVPIYRDSWIIVLISRRSEAAFRNPGIYLKSQSQYYGGMRYVDDNGPHKAWVSNCRVILFAARFVQGSSSNPHIQSFEYDVDPVARFVPIDPDIRHPGNGGQVVDP